MSYNARQNNSTGFFGNRGVDFKTIFSFKDISEKTQQHLTKVYSMLVVCSLICATGMWVNSALILSGFIMNMLSIICTIYLVYQISNKRNSEDSRMIFLGALAFQLGFLVGPAIHRVAQFNPQILM